MKTYYLLFFVLLISFGCKKEGLSKDTGNVEITVPDWTSWMYSIYTEDQFLRLLDFQTAYPIRTGTAYGKIAEKELLKGNYGVMFYRDGTGYKKAFQVIAGKVNKYTMP